MKRASELLGSRRSESSRSSQAEQGSAGSETGRATRGTESTACSEAIPPSSGKRDRSGPKPESPRRIALCGSREGGLLSESLSLDSAFKDARMQRGEQALASEPRPPARVGGRGWAKLLPARSAARTGHVQFISLARLAALCGPPGGS